jgi:hypothetical protein
MKNPNLWHARRARRFVKLFSVLVLSEIADRRFSFHHYHPKLVARKCPSHTRFLIFISKELGDSIGLSLAYRSGKSNLGKKYMSVPITKLIEAGALKIF